MLKIKNNTKLSYQGFLHIRTTVIDIFNGNFIIFILTKIVKYLRSTQREIKSKTTFQYFAIQFLLNCRLINPSNIEYRIIYLLQFDLILYIFSCKLSKSETICVNTKIRIFRGNFEKNF